VRSVRKFIELLVLPLLMWLVLVKHLVLVQQRASMLAVEELQQARHLLLPNIVYELCQQS
jgi:hypothetical protein